MVTEEIKQKIKQIAKLEEEVSAYLSTLHNFDTGEECDCKGDLEVYEYIVDNGYGVNCAAKCCLNCGGIVEE